MSCSFFLLWGLLYVWGFLWVGAVSSRPQWACLLFLFHSLLIWRGTSFVPQGCYSLALGQAALCEQKHSPWSLPTCFSWIWVTQFLFLLRSPAELRRKVTHPFLPVPFLCCSGGSLRWCGRYGTLNIMPGLSTSQTVLSSKQPKLSQMSYCASSGRPGFDFRDLTARISESFDYVSWLLSLSCRDQSCTDILEIYNKVKAEDLSSTDEEEEVRPWSLVVRTSCLLKFSTGKKFGQRFLGWSFYFKCSCTECLSWAYCVAHLGLKLPYVSKNESQNCLSLIFCQYTLFSCERQR